MAREHCPTTSRRDGLCLRDLGEDVALGCAHCVDAPRISIGRTIDQGDVEGRRWGMVRAQQNGSAGAPYVIEDVLAARLVEQWNFVIMLLMRLTGVVI